MARQRAKQGLKPVEPDKIGPVMLSSPDPKDPDEAAEKYLLDLGEQALKSDGKKEAA